MVVEEPVAQAIDSLLFGFDPVPGVVAVEVDEGQATLIRVGPPDPAGKQIRVRETRPFRPWLLADESLDPGFDAPGLRGAQWTRLHGSGLAWLIEPTTWSAFQALRDSLRAQGIRYYAYSGPVKQFLVRSGITLFRGLDFQAIRRLQFDLETTGLAWNAPDSRILLAVASDNRGGEWVFSGADERQFLGEFLDLIGEVDPDVIEGHNLFAFDIPYLVARCEALGLPVSLGRNGSSPGFGRERNVPIGGLTRPFTPAYIWGRHLLDTLFGVHRFDVGRGELESHGLKEVARHYGIASEERVYVDRSRLAELWESDPDRVRRYALQDVEETRRLAELVLPTEFYQTQMVPESYQGVATGGSGEKINSLLIREYLRQGQAIPHGQPPIACPGGHTDIRATGLLRRVVKADVESLYPSIMLHYGIHPETDTLGVFLPMLRELTGRRMEAKKRARERAGEADGAYWDGLQGSFKILINSFYGYLGAHFHFNDYRAATQVTTTGQVLVKQVADALERTGSRVIEIDTDGVYFVPPDEVQSEAEEHAYVARIGETLPHGIRLAHDGRYAAMLSLKVKNYVLLDYRGRKVFKGASLRSRADEVYGREFIVHGVDHLMSGDLQALAAEYAALCEQIATGQMPISQLARRERITEKTLNGGQNRRSRAVARRFQVGDTLTVYQRADGTVGLADEYAHDEDRWHYLEKLHKFAGRFQDVLGDDFERIFPRPVKKQLEARLSGQMSLF